MISSVFMDTLQFGVGKLTKLRISRELLLDWSIWNSDRNKRFETMQG